jgi:hypothetical protein
VYLYGHNIKILNNKHYSDDDLIPIKFRIITIIVLILFLRKNLNLLQKDPYFVEPILVWDTLSLQRPSEMSKEETLHPSFAKP